MAGGGIPGLRPASPTAIDITRTATHAVAFFLRAARPRGRGMLFSGKGRGRSACRRGGSVSQVFISYANEDTAFAKRLAGAFEALGWSVWWDKQIPPGMDYAQAIEQAVTAARCIVVLWSQHAIRSRWVNTEAAVGADRHIAATVIIDQTRPDQVPFEFRRLQAVDLRDWQPGVPHPHFDLLVRRVASILDQPPPAPPRPPDPTPPPSDRLVPWKEALTTWGSGRQRRYRIGGFLATLVAVGGVSEGLEMGDTDTLTGGLFFLGLAVYLLHAGRRPA